MAARAATTPVSKSSNDAVTKGPWALFKRALSADLRRGFVSPTASNDVPNINGTLLDAELSNAIFIASGAERKAHTGTHYKDNSLRIRADLLSAKERIEAVLGRYTVAQRSSFDRRKGQDAAQFTLARINTALGDYSTAHAIYDFLTPPTGEDTPTILRMYGEYLLEIIMAYLRFQAHTRRDLDHALELGLALIAVDRTAEERRSLLLSIINIYNARGEFDIALTYLHEHDRCVPTASTGEEAYQKISMHTLDAYDMISVQKTTAINAAGLGRRAEANRAYLSVLIQSAVILGMWHPLTMSILFEFGNALRIWGDHQAAAAMLGECSLGYHHRLGDKHPTTTSTYTNLKFCRRSQPQLEALKCFQEADSGDESKFSIAYEHIYLNTVIELLISAGMESSLEEVEIILKSLLDIHKTLRASEPRVIFARRIHRAIARCNYRQGKIQEAIKAIEEVNLSTNQSLEGDDFLSKLDLVLFHHANPDTKSKAAELSRSIFFEADQKLEPDQARAFQRQLSALGCTHFTTSGPNDSLPIKTIENIGTGAYAVVESVEISGRLYARKSISLPRYNQKRIRQTIQNEISVIRALAHPHIVQVYCTYEEKSRFSMVLQPLATFDLEVYLEQYTQPTSTTTAADTETNSLSTPHPLLWKWLRCLSNTLAFIHSKGIRHKDIKTRNILVKDSEVLYADFGSSHAFLDEGNSVTEGPAFGHTLMYCAPEVVSWEKRSRSADVFSLGCVFTEIATAMDGREIGEFYEFRCNRSGEGQVHAYHATLDLVDEWFGDGRAGEGVVALYREVVKPMLGREPAERPSASVTGNAVTLCFKDIMGEELEECSKCCPMQADADGIDVNQDEKS